MALEPITKSLLATVLPETNGIGEGSTEPFIGNGIESSRSVDRIADKLVDKLQSRESRRFYCQVAQSLTEFKIDQLVVEALKYGRVPAKLFNHLARKEMARDTARPSM